jgi:hypothetical protein
MRRSEGIRAVRTRPGETSPILIATIRLLARATASGASFRHFSTNRRQLWTDALVDRRPRQAPSCRLRPHPVWFDRKEPTAEACRRERSLEQELKDDRAAARSERGASSWRMAASRRLCCPFSLMTENSQGNWCVPFAAKWGTTSTTAKTIAGARIDSTEPCSG